MLRPYFLFLLCAFISLALAASPPSFCKCTCFSNSTIIQLVQQSNTPPSGEPTPANLLTARAGNGGSSCNKCNKAFCLSQGIPFCKGAEDKDVFTTCFQRDSRKDQIIVLLFIATTLGLLGWAAVRKVLDKRAERLNSAANLGDYAAVTGR